MGETAHRASAIFEWNGWRPVSGALFLLLAGYFIVQAIYNPAWDWDVVAYTVAALKSGTADPLAAVAESWAIIKDRLPEHIYQQYTLDGGFGQKSFEDPAALLSQMPLFDSKLGYVLLLRLLSFVVEPPTAIIALSVAAALGTVTVLFRESWKSGGLVALAWLPAEKLFGVTSTMMTPDPLATFICVLGVAFLLSQRLYAALSLFVLGVFVRPENIVFSVVLGVFLALRLRSVALLFIAASLLVYLLDVAVSRHVGWWPQVHTNFVASWLDFREPMPPFSFAAYLAILKSNTVLLLHASWPYAFLATILVTLGLLSRTRTGLTVGVRIEDVLLAMILTIVLRFVVYPSTAERLYGPVLLGSALIAIHAAGLALKHHKPPP